MRKTFMVLVALVMALAMVVGSASTASAAPTRISVTNVTVSRDTMTITAGSIDILMASIQPYDATNQRVSWTTSDRRVATVSGYRTGDSGEYSGAKITCASNGTATITVKTADGGFTASCVVTVTAPLAALSLPYTESFTGCFENLQSGWFETYSRKTQPWQDLVFGTDCLFFYYGNYGVEADYRASTPVIDATAATTALNLSFYCDLNHYMNEEGQPYSVAVEVSTDGGRTWGSTSFLSNNVSTSIGPETMTVDLAAYKGKKIMISWHMWGYTYWSNYWLIDDISVTGS